MTTTTHVEGVFGPMKDGLARSGSIEMLAWLGVTVIVVGLLWLWCWWSRRMLRVTR